MPLVKQFMTFKMVGKKLEDYAKIVDGLHNGVKFGTNNGRTKVHL